MINEVQEASLVSVIVTTYNRPNYLGQTLKSIAEQTYNDIEILVVDDGSKDINAFENQKISDQYTICNYYYKKNTGQPDSRNYGIKKAKGDYIAFCDDDDLWVQNKLELQVKKFESNPDIGVVTGCIDYIDNLNNKLNKKKCHKGFNHGYVFENFLEKNRTSSIVPIVKVGVFDKVGYFNPNFTIAEDWEFWRRVSFYFNFYFIDEILAYVRVHDENMSLIRTNDPFEQFLLYRKLTKALLDWGDNYFCNKDKNTIFKIEKKIYDKLFKNHLKKFQKIYFLKQVFCNDPLDFLHILFIYIKY